MKSWHTYFLDFISDNLNKKLLRNATNLEYSYQCLSYFILHQQEPINSMLHDTNTNILSIAFNFLCIDNFVYSNHIIIKQFEATTRNRSYSEVWAK